MIVVELTDRDLYRLHEIGDTPNPPSWVASVEEFVKGELISRTGAARGARALAVCDSSGWIVAVAAHRPHPQFLAEHLQAFVVSVQHRGQGTGELALREVLAEVQAESEHDEVLWHVHVDNLAARKLSAKVGVQVVIQGAHVTFVHP